MFNVFVNSTTFGQAMGATFDLSIEGSLADKRVTAPENCKVLAPIYERKVDANRVTSFISTGQTQQVSKLAKAVDVENVRVNSLAVLIRELQMISEIDTDCMIIAYMPLELLQEVESGRVKFYMSGETTTTYYSQTELDLWRTALSLIQSLYCRIVFKNINACKKNNTNSPVQADRVNINASMYNMLLTAFRELKAERTKPKTTPAVSGEPIF